MKIGYARVSTRKQSLESQVEQLQRYGVDRLYQEAASGSRAPRPILDRCLGELRPGDALVVTRLSRLGRSVGQLVRTVEQLHEQQIDLVSLHESIDTSNPAGRLVFHVFAALAEFERELIRDNVAAGLEAARAAGRVPGRPPQLNDEQRRAMRELIAAGMPKAEAARVLKVSRATVYRGLRQA